MRKRDIEYQHHYNAIDPRLGRHIVHDQRSKAFGARAAIDRSTWRDKSVRIYDPLPNPNQCHGECTGVAKCCQFNAVDNRVKGTPLGMDDAHNIYSRNTQIDIWEGEWPPTDTGSSGVASAKAAQELLGAGAYYWYFGGADEVVQGVMDGKVISVGTRWDYDMFNPDGDGRVQPGGGVAGGHQYVVRGYWKSRDWVLGRCWWGEFRDFWMSRTHLDQLLHDYGDAHWQARR